MSTPDAAHSDPQTSRRATIDKWVEIVAAVVLSLATIASAWSAYQATRWSGVMAVAFSEASAARVEASTASTRAGQKTAADIGIFTDWLAATAAEEDELADFMRARFRPEFVPAFDAWLAERPLQNPQAPATPFDLDDYQIAEAREAQERTDLAEAKGLEARTANQNGDNYVLTTVLFASVLFFAGISTKFATPLAKESTLALGVVAFVAGTWFIISFPVH